MNEELKILITAEIGKMKQEIDNAKKQIKGLRDTGEREGGKFSKAMASIGKATVSAMKVLSGAVIAGATALIALSESTTEYTTAQAKLNSAFETAGGSAETAKQTYNELYRVLGDSDVAVEAAGHLAQLTTSQKDLSEWTTICQGVYATFGDSLPIEGLTEAANETAKVGQVTGTLADALNWAGVSEEAFNQALADCNTEAEREELIRNTLNGIYKDAAERYEENAKELLKANEAQEKMTNGLAELGKAVRPVITVFKSLIGDVLQEMVPYFNLVGEGLQEMIEGVEGGSDKMQEGISGIMNVLVDTITNMLPTLLEIGTEIIISLINGIIAALPSLVQAIVDFIPTLITNIVNAFTALVEALPTIIQSIVDALPELIPTLINGIVNMILAICNNFALIIQPIIDALPDIIISIVDGLLSNLPQLIEGLITLVIGIVQAIPQIIEGIISALPDIIVMIIDSLIECTPQIIAGLIMVVAEIVMSLPEIFMSLVDGIGEIFTGIWEKIKEIFIPASEWFSDTFTESKDGIAEAFAPIGEFFSGIWEGIKEAFAPMGDWFIEKFTEAKTNIEDVFNTLGEFFTNIWEGIKNIFSNVGEWFSEKFTTASTNIKTAFSTIGDFFSGIWEGIKSVFSSVGTWFSEKFTAVKDAITTTFNNIITPITNVFNSVKTTVKTAIDKVKSFFDFDWELPKLKMPKISITGEFSLNPLQVPKFSITWNKLGGIFDKPALFGYGGSLQGLGEDGAEAVVPLEKNLGWLDKLASMLNERMGGGTPIYLTVDGKVFAETSINTINDLTRQTGHLGLKIV